jgi:hypothetical protein
MQYASPCSCHCHLFGFPILLFRSALGLDLMMIKCKVHDLGALILSWLLFPVIRFSATATASTMLFWANETFGGNILYCFNVLCLINVFFASPIALLPYYLLCCTLIQVHRNYAFLSKKDSPLPLPKNMVHIDFIYKQRGHHHTNQTTFHSQRRHLDPCFGDEALGLVKDLGKRLILISAWLRTLEDRNLNSFSVVTGNIIS